MHLRPGGVVKEMVSDGLLTKKLLSKATRASTRLLGKMFRTVTLKVFDVELASISSGGTLYSLIVTL